MAEGNLHSTSEQKVFYVYGIPQDQLSSEQNFAMVKDFFKQKGIKEINVVGDKVKVVVHGTVSIETMREKFSSFEAHDLLILPELFREVRVHIDEEWIKVKDQCHLQLKPILREIGVAVDKSPDGVFLTGSLDAIGMASQIIQENIDAEISKNKLSTTPRKMSGHSSERGIHAGSELAAESSSVKELATGSLANHRSNGTSVDEHLKESGVGSNGENGNCSKSDPNDSNDVPFAAADLGATGGQSDGPVAEPIASGHHSRNLASSTNTNGMVETTSAEHRVDAKDQVTTSIGRFNERMTAVDHKSNETIEGGSNDRRMDVSKAIHLDDCQWLFMQHFHSDLYELLRSYDEQNHGLTDKQRIHVLDIIKEKNINRVVKTIEIVKNYDWSVLLKCADKLPSALRVRVRFSSDYSNVEIIGLPEDAERWWILLRQEIAAYESDRSKKKLQASHAIQIHQLQFLETFYPDEYGYIQSYHVQEKSKNEILYAGTFDEVDKLKKWLRDRNIDRLETEIEAMPNFVDEENCKEVRDSMLKGQIKLHLSFPKARMYKAIGFGRDIRSFKEKLKQIDEVKKEKLLAKTISSSRTEYDSSHLYGATSSSDKDFAFQTPLSSIQVKIARGNLTTQKTAAIVNPCNGLLKHFGGAAKAIADAAGWELREDCEKYIKKNKMLPISEVMHSRSGRLDPPIKFVIHASGPSVTDHPDRKKCRIALENTFLNCFEYANNKLQVDSLSVPAISSGTFGVPKDVVAECAWDALMRFDDQMSKTKSDKCLKYICFINIDQESTNSLIQTFKKHWNAYLFEQKSKVEAAQSETSRKSPSSLRRSGSFSDRNRRTLKDQESAIAVTMTTRASTAKGRQYEDSTELSKSVRGTTSLGVQPQIKSGTARSADKSSTAEAKCCVCFNMKKASCLFVRSNCPHKSCVSCRSEKCMQCRMSIKNESGPPSTRTQVLSPTGAKKENDIVRRPESPETMSGGNTTQSRRSRRSASVGGVRDLTPYAVDIDQGDERDENRAMTAAAASSIDNHQRQQDDKCCICMDKIDDPKKLDCGHVFCRDCIDKQFTHQPKCPSCGRIFGLLKGNQPNGKMTVEKSKYTQLEGYPGCGAIVISYSIPDGVQTDDHPNPGQRFHGTSRTAYLPGNAEGEEVCRLLKKAFDAKLIFTVGKSNTTGRENVVVWNDIHHKTSPTGQYGYPDPTYLQRVKDELAAKGIKSDTAAAAAAAASLPVDSRGRNSPDNPVNRTTGGAAGGYDVHSNWDDNHGYASLPVTGVHASSYVRSRDSGAPLSLLSSTEIRSFSSHPRTDIASVHTASSRSPDYSSLASVHLGSHLPLGSSSTRSTTGSHEPWRTLLYTSTTSSLPSSSPTSGTGRYDLRSSSRSTSSANTQPYVSKYYP